MNSRALWAAAAVAVLAWSSPSLAFRAPQTAPHAATPKAPRIVNPAPSAPGGISSGGVGGSIYNHNGFGARSATGCGSPARPAACP